MRLAHLMQTLPGARRHGLNGGSDLEVSGIAHDSRSVRPGFVFVAFKGTSVDGHDYVADAVRRGAAAVVAERRVDLPPAIPLMRVADARRAVAALSSHFHGHPSRKLCVVAATGTNGKTTTTYLVRSILAAAGHESGLIGTIRHETGRRGLPASMTTPGPVDIHTFLGEMVAEGLGHAVMEMSSHALSQHRADFVECDVAIFTNLTRDHLDYHRTMSAYRQAKGKLFESLRPQGWAILNADDPASTYLAGRTCARVLRYGLRRSADLRARVRRMRLEGTEFRLSTREKEVTVRLPLVGRHNVYNALAAAAAGIALGFDLATIRQGLENVPVVAGRLEAVRCGQAFPVLVDYAHTEDAMRSVLTALRPLVGGRLIVVFGAGGDRDRAKRPAMGRAANELADLSWVTSDNPRSEDPGEIIDEICSGVADARRVRVEQDRRTAIAQALAEATAGDLVLIAGKGHETVQTTRHGAAPFDDRQVVRWALAEARQSSLAGA